MLIVIPTYKRNSCLKLVLQSLVQCRTENIKELIRVIVINNYPPSAKEIEAIVGQFLNNKRFEWKILFREQTLMPVDNWYSAIVDNALPDEIVFINSDDDLFLPWSLESRYREIIKFDADILLAQLGSTAFFSKNCQKILCEYQSVESNIEAIPLSIISFYSFNPLHISNHCYKNSVSFRRSLEKSMFWCNELDWLDYNNRTLFVTLMLPIALILYGGKTIGLASECIIRGREIEEITQSRFGIPSWNHGFIHLCALCILNNRDLKNITELDPIRHSFTNQYIYWFFTYFIDRRVGVKKAWITMKKASFSLSKLFSLKILHGIPLVAKDLFHLNGIKISRKSEVESIDTTKFLQEMARF